MSATGRAPQSEIRVRVMTAFFCILVISYLAPLMMSLGDFGPRSFALGYQDGYRDMGVSRSVIGAVLFTVVFLFRRSLWTFAGANVLTINAIMNWMAYSSSFDHSAAAVAAILPGLLFACIASPTSWLEYVFVYRAIAVPKPAASDSDEENDDTHPFHVSEPPNGP